jgi:small subunit ribosomal protein S17
MTQATTTEKNTKKIRQFQGVVVSVSGHKTIHVEVRSKKTHPIYKKQYWVSKKYPVHDPKGLAKKGDSVLFQECRPISKTKRWRMLSVLNA